MNVVEGLAFLFLIGVVWLVLGVCLRPVYEKHVPERTCRNCVSWNNQAVGGPYGQCTQAWHVGLSRETYEADTCDGFEVKDNPHLVPAARANFHMRRWPVPLWAAPGVPGLGEQSAVQDR